MGFYVPTYMGPRNSLELIAQMPNLEVVQLLTVAFDAALEYVPDHVSLCNAVGVVTCFSDGVMVRIPTMPKRPAPECLGMLSLGVAEPVRMNCPGSPRSSAARRTASHS